MTLVTVRRPMVVVSFADFGQNNHREDVPDFTSRLKTEQFSPVYEPLHLQGIQNQTDFVTQTRDPWIEKLSSSHFYVIGGF